MQKLLITLSLLALTVVASHVAPTAEAASPGVLLTASFAGCSGNEATYDLTATIANGGTFTWSWNVTPVSGPYADPNLATISFVTWQRQASVSVVNKMTSDSASISLSNPCISP